MSYTCFVPTCSNTKHRTPNKTFVHVIDCLKETWCRQLNIKYEPNKRYYCCEDHLNLEEDLDNYQYWKLMKGRPRLKNTASLRLSTPQDPGSSSELQRLLMSRENLPPKGFRKCASHTSKAINTADIAIQCKARTEEKGTNYIARKMLPSRASQYVPEALMLSSPTTNENPSSFGCTSDTISDTTKNLQLREYYLDIIYENPRRYLGVPKQFWWLLKYISEQSSTNITQLHLIIALFKIRQNDSMFRLSDQFQVCLSALSSIFMRGVETLGNFFQNLIYLPLPLQIKKQLPTVFKVRYSNVQMILDCFEIEIEKPSNPLRQAQTWSQYKSCNTIKYLIGCTPNGFVAFISKGFGGRISDKAILENSNLIDILPFNAVVMADRGFKEVETHLMTKNIKLLRPPSVYSGTKPTKEQVIQTKVIASLRVHVERVIRRIREFRMLKPHSVVKYRHVGHMDAIVIIACGLINLQGNIIKNE